MAVVRRHGVNKSNPRDILLTVALTAMAVAAVSTLVIGRMHWNGVLIDLEVYRMGGRTVLDAGPLYEVQYRVGGLGFTYTPFAALFFVPAALLSAFGAATVWTVLSFGALARSCHLLAREVPRAWPASWSILQATLCLFAVAFLLEPVVATVGFGQINLIIMWAVLEDVLRRNGSRAGGLLTGLAAGIKLIPGIFAVFLFAIGRRGDALRAVATAAGTVALGFVLLPSESWAYWTGVAYDDTRVGEIGYVSNQSLNGVLARTVEGGARPLMLLGALTIIGTTLLLARALWAQGHTLFGVAIMAMGSLLASPISWSHHWVWFLVAGVALLDRARDDRVALILLAGIVAVSVQPIHDETYSMIWQVAHQSRRSGIELLAANAYFIMAVAFVAYGAWLTRAPRGTGRVPPGPGRGQAVTGAG
jgi:alpha-1,2-mannosyltransferase